MGRQQYGPEAMTGKNIGMAERFGWASRGEGQQILGNARPTTILRNPSKPAGSGKERLGKVEPRLTTAVWPQEARVLSLLDVGASQRLAVRASQPSQLIIAHSRSSPFRQPAPRRTSLGGGANCQLTWLAV